MELVILGSGTALPYARRNSAGYALRVGRETVLLDAGSGTLRRAAEAEIDLFAVRRVFLSHFHLDHVNDIGAILFAKRHPGLARNEDLAIHGPPGVRALHEGLRAAHGAWMDAKGYALEIDEVDPAAARPVRGRGFETRAIAVKHTAHSVGWRFEEEESGKTLAYSGDSGPCEALVELGRGADVFLIECSLPDGTPIDIHLTPADAGRIGRAAGARRLVLTHLYREMDSIDTAAAVRRHYDGEVTVAEDLMRIRV